MALLFLDLETSGLPRRDLPLGDPAQPWAIAVAADHCDDDGRTINAIRALIRPEGRKVKDGARAVHGIDPSFAERKGVAETKILSLLAEMAGKDRTLAVVSYTTLDPWVIESLMVRLEEQLGKPFGTFRNRWVRPGLQFIDIQKPACQLECRIPGEFDDGSYRWPSLDESCRVILGEEPRQGHHDAWDDLSRLKRLWAALRARGHFPTVEVAA